VKALDLSLPESERKYRQWLPLSLEGEYRGGCNLVSSLQKKRPNPGNLIR
jgi:hypothetical protein